MATARQPKITIKPPAKPLLKKASKDLRKGGSLGGRVESERSEEKRERAKKKPR